MRILLLSDSHNEKINLPLKDYDMVLHCGDYGISLDTLLEHSCTYVRGNCDSKGPDELILDIFGRKVFITHGHHYGVKSSYDRIKYRALELGCSVVVFGHTHIPIWQPEADLLSLNPGAYMDGFRIEISDHEINYFMDEKNYKKFEFTW